MIDLNTGVAVLAAVLGVWAGVLYWPRPPDLDGERWFKVMLSTLFFGQVDTQKGSAEEWEALTERFVPYHPAGRFPESKVLNPAASPPGKWLPGELKLTESLAAVSSVAERWAVLYDSEVGRHARLVDPFDLGPAYDPKSFGDPACTWDALCLWGNGETAFRDALLSRLGAKWILVEGRADRRCGPSVLDAMSSELGDLAVRVPWHDGPIKEAVAALDKVLGQSLEDWQDRVIVVSEEAGTTVVLRALADNGFHRDPLLAVLSVGGVIGGREGEEGPFGQKACEDWLAAWFTYLHMNSESVRLTPYLSAQFLDRAAPTPGSNGLSLAAQRFPEARDDKAMQTLESVDLGVLPAADDLPVDQVARALLAVTSCWALTRR